MNIIGFDVSKDTVDCFLIKNNQNNLYFKEFNNLLGFKKIHQMIKNQNIRKIIVVMEATGIYYEEIANYFSQYYPVYVINPLKIKQHANKTFNRTKTDKADAKLIADYGKRFYDELIPYQKPTQKQYLLNKLNTLQEQLKEEIKRHKNQIHSSKNEYIISVHQKLIDELENQLELTNQEILKVVESEDFLKSHYHNLMTIPCMNKHTALILLNHLLMKDFKTVNKFTAYAGLSPQIFESGKSVKKPDKLSRLGNSRLKASLFMPALSAMRTKYFRQFVERLRKNGKKPKIIVIALMRKILKLAYYLFKSQKPFDLNYLAK